MFGTNISGSKVDNRNNHVYNSGNTNYNFTFHAATSASGARSSTREDFEEFKVTVKLPFRKNENFCGRDAILEQLHHVLHPSNASGNISGRKTAILYGMGGVGKSQIALEYAHRDRFSHGYTSIFWIDAENSSRADKSAIEVMEQLVAHYAKKWHSSPDFAEIANILGIPGKIDDLGRLMPGATENALEAFHGWLRKQENGGWLLLIDNKDKAEVGDLNKILPTCNWGSVIITSRLSNLKRYGKCIEIEGLEGGAGLELMLKSSGISQQNLDGSELAEAKEIVAALGELPLALDQAAAYICSKQITFSAFRKKLNELAMEVTFKTDLSELSLSSCKASVFTTWELSFQELCDDARRLLLLCAFLSNDDIPEELFRRGKKTVDWILEDEDRLEKAMEDLFAFSLAKRKNSGDSFWIHPLIHTWARERQTSTVRLQNAETAITLVASTIVTNDNERSSADWISAQRIPSHLNVCQENILKYFSGSGFTHKAAEASLAIASAYGQLGFFNEEEVSYRSALTGLEKMLGSDHPSTLATVNNIASVFSDQGRDNEALKMYQRALAGREKTLGSDHPSTLSSVNNIASVLRNQGRYNEALEMYQRALMGNEKSLGSDHLVTLTVLNNIASVFRNQGRYNEALEMYQKVLAGREKTLGSDHPSTMTTLDNIASVFDDQGRYKEALEMYQRVLTGNEKTLGSDHLSTLSTLHNIASVFRNQGRFNESLEMYQRALAGFEKALGSCHPSTLTTMNNIASVFRRQGRYNEALEMHQRALIGKEMTRGSHHPDTLTAVHNMALVYDEQGRDDMALEMYQRVLAGREKVLGSDHPSTLTTMSCIASVFFRQERYNEALELHQRALAGKEKTLGSDHPGTLSTVNNLALLFSHHEQYNEALEMYQRVLIGNEKALGSDHPDTLTTVHNIACVYYEQGRDDDALKWFQRALTGREKALGKNHPSTLGTARLMAIVSAKQEGGKATKLKEKCKVQ